MDDEYNTSRNELTQAFHIYLQAAFICVQLPTIIGRIYLSLNFQYRRSVSTMNRYLERMIEQELSEISETRAERKRTSFIASLVDSLQSEENKKGLMIISKNSLYLLFVSFRSFTR